MQASLSLLPQTQAELEEGLTFSVDALSQIHSKAGLFPQEQVAFLAQTQLAWEQVIIYELLLMLLAKDFDNENHMIIFCRLIWNHTFIYSGWMII